jgi:hypothetical protein
LISELKKLDGVQMYTDPAPGRSANIVIFKPGTLDPRRFYTALGEKEGSRRHVARRAGSPGAPRCAAPVQHDGRHDSHRGGHEEVPRYWSLGIFASTAP